MDHEQQCRLHHDDDGRNCAQRYQGVCMHAILVKFSKGPKHRQVTPLPMGSMPRRLRLSKPIITRIKPMSKDATVRWR